MNDLAARSRKGATAFHSGVAAEESVARFYSRNGYRLIAKRWRGRGGEIDLVFGTGDLRVFVEVKKSGSFSTAALRVTQKQIRRIFAAAEEFLGTEPAGLLTDTRFDVALVDTAGEIEVLENALVAE